MSEVKKKKKKLSTSALVLIIACIIIAIPIIVFLAIIISASLNTGKPILGDRFANDLNPAISDSQESAIVSEVKNMSGVDDCEIVMTSAQLRVNVDAKDSLTDTEAEELTDQIYEVVNKTLPVNTYFTMSSDGEKMYDLQINVYNYIATSTEDENWVSYLLVKNSKMEEPEKQLISKPLNPDLAKELRGETAPEEDATGEEGQTATN